MQWGWRKSKLFQCSAQFCCVWCIQQSLLQLWWNLHMFHQSLIVIVISMLTCKFEWVSARTRTHLWSKCAFHSSLEQCLLKVCKLDQLCGKSPELVQMQ